MQTKSFSGFESKTFHADADPEWEGLFNPDSYCEDCYFGHSTVGRIGTDSGYAKSHDFIFRNTDAWTNAVQDVPVAGSVLSGINGFLKVATNLGPYEAVYFGTILLAE